ncbi:hypothetical protein QR680_014517 [Steinernema hermaphroditum]|uniref:Uncharacterized protein n=1 Tax=Steinernema hermaphroditum TaxID=289476 RepID=A0AA39IBB3_9BILA|nr:hypothetical protein QR680_014517 [Steinernema hermaphroditum]
MVSLTINCQNADIMCSMAPHGRKRKYRFFNDFVKEELVGLIPDVHVKLNVETHESSTGSDRFPLTQNHLSQISSIVLHFPNIWSINITCDTIHASNEELKNFFHDLLRPNSLKDLMLPIASDNVYNCIVQFIGDHPNLMQIFLHYPDITGSADMFNEFKENISTIVERNGKIVETFNMCTYPLMYSVFLTVAGEENVFKYPLPQISGRRVS